MTVTGVTDCSYLSPFAL